MRRRWIALIAGAVVLVAGAGFVPAGATTKQFCAAYKTFSLLYEEQFELGAPPTDEIVAVDDELDRLVTKVEKAAPNAIADDVTLVADLFQSGFANVVATIIGQGEDYGNAIYRVDEWALEHCGFRVIDVTAVDFAYEGLPKTVKPGFVAFRVGNDSDQDHLFLVVRMKRGVTAKDLATLSLNELLLRRVEVIAAAVTAAPGFQVASYAQLTKPGRYAAVDPGFLQQKMTTEFRVKR